MLLVFLTILAKDKKVGFKSKCLNGRIIGLECEQMAVTSILYYITLKYISILSLVTHLGKKYWCILVY